MYIFFNKVKSLSNVYAHCSCNICTSRDEDSTRCSCVHIINACWVNSREVWWEDSVSFNGISFRFGERQTPRRDQSHKEIYLWREWEKVGRALSWYSSKDHLNRPVGSPWPQVPAGRVTELPGVGLLSIPSVPFTSWEQPGRQLPGRQLGDHSAMLPLGGAQSITFWWLPCSNAQGDSLPGALWGWLLTKNPLKIVKLKVKQHWSLLYFIWHRNFDLAVIKFCFLFLLFQYQNKILNFARRCEKED